MKKYIISIAVALISSASLFAQDSKISHRDHNNKHQKVEHRDNHRHVCVDPIATPEQIDDVVKFVKKQSFDDDKMEAAKLCIKLRSIPTEGLIKIAKLFSFDNKRSDFLVFAYNYCPDKENYYKLRNTFSFQSEGDAFMKRLKL